MVIAVLGGERIIEKIRKLAESENLFCDLEYYSNYSYPEIADTVEKIQDKYDALLFTGIGPYQYSKEYVKDTIPWFYLPHSRQALMGAMLTAQAKYHCDLTRMSIDSYEPDLVYSVYEEIGCSKDNISLHIAEIENITPAYRKRMIQFHKSNYSQKLVSCCISGLDSVVAALLEANIPCVKIDSPVDVIRQTINSIRLEQMARESDRNEIASIIIKLKLFNRQLCGATALEDFRVISQAKEYLYRFAQRINAIVLEITSTRFLLLSSKQTLAQHTRQFQDFIFLKAMTQCNNMEAVFAGIGLGASFQTSLNNAENCFDKAEAYGQSCFYLKEEDALFKGPFSFNCSDTVSFNKKPVNEKLLLISGKTGIGIATLQKLLSAVEENSIEVTTSEQLGNLLHLSQRSVNRIILKLEDIGCISEAGKEVHVGPGRPHRLLKINLHKFI